MTKVHGLQIAPARGEPALTPEQKRFNTLIRQIEQARRLVADWRDNTALYLQAHTKVLVPLIAAYEAARREQALTFDRLLDQPGWTKAERATLRELVCDSVAQILESADEDDPALKAIFDKHADVDLDTERHESRMVLKDMMEAMTGIDLGDDDDIASDEDLIRRMHEGMAAAHAESAAPWPERPRRKGAAHKRREDEAQLAAQSIREVFRKLASALHPDRETDPDERKAKTALMQRVNQAYAANDLLTLLELQLQIEHVDAGHAATAGTQRLKHYNKVLAEQLAELRAEASRLEVEFRFDFGHEEVWPLNPARLGRLVESSAKACRADLAMLQRDMHILDDRAAAKRWLKRERQRLRDDAFDGDLPF